MLLSQKKATVTQKTLEGVLSFDATATEDKVSISSRCADLDAMLPEQLGVSKAVLENVIFCHQEESNWPLSEASILKKKFDEIFAATRYTKALESIKTIRKNQSVEIRVQRGELKHLEEKQAKAERVRVEYEKSTVAIHEYRTRIDGIQREEEQITSQIEALAEQLQEFMRLHTLVQGLQMSIDEKVASYGEMAANTKVVEVSDQELQRMGADVARQIESQGSDGQRQRDERDGLQQQCSAAQAEINGLLSEIGRLQAARDSLESKTAGRAAVIAEIIEAVGLASSSARDPDSQAGDCAAQIEARLASAESERAEARQRGEARERDLQAAIGATQAQIYDHSNAAALGERQISSNESEMDALRKKHARLQTDDAHARRIEEELAAETSQLGAAQAQDSEGAFNELAKQKRLELAGIADEIARLNSEIARNNMQADTRAKLALQRLELDSKETRRGELAACSELARFRASGEAADRGGSSALISEAIKAKRQAAGALASSAKECYSELSSSRMRLALAQQAHARQDAEAGDKEARIRLACGEAAYDSVYGAAQAELHELMEMAGHYKSASSMYKAYIQKIEADHACPVCQRGWGCHDDELRVVSRLRVDYTSAPAELLRVEGDIRDSERRLDELGAMRASVCDVREWREGGKADLEAQITALAAA
ncbi:DNA repair protein rad50, partial [Coemansia sp. RSA 2320]